MGSHSFKTKKDMALEYLTEAIMSGEVEPGEWLRQHKLCELLGISATPVREALSELVTEGVLEHISHMGVRVPLYSSQRFEELWMIRRVLEPLAAKYAAPNIGQAEIFKLNELQSRLESKILKDEHKGLQEINYAFHHQIFEASRMPELIQIIKGIWIKIPWNLLRNMPERPRQAAAEHKRILEAINIRDPDLVAQRMKQHIDIASRRLRDFWRLGSIDEILQEK
jgi:DNA-binding GntR family transcriptional regulator